MPRPLIIVGDSSFAEVACQYFSRQGKYEVVSFSVDRDFLRQDTLLGLPVTPVDELSVRYPPHTHSAFIALTYRELNRARARLAARFESLGYDLASFISEDANVWPNTKIGANSFIFEANVVQPFVKIGKNVVLWSGNHIGHHSTIKDNVFIASHVVVSGHVTIGENSFLGVNATVADTVRVGKYNWIGPNALITQDTEEGAMYRTEATPLSKVRSYRFFKIQPDDA